MLPLFEHLIFCCIPFFVAIFNISSIPFITTISTHDGVSCERECIKNSNIGHKSIRISNKQTCKQPYYTWNVSYFGLIGSTLLTFEEVYVAIYRLNWNEMETKLIVLNIFRPINSWYQSIEYLFNPNTFNECQFHSRFNNFEHSIQQLFAANLFFPV